MPTLQKESDSALVIGGWISGVKAALVLCDAGFYVNPVERALRVEIHTQRHWHLATDPNFVKQQRVE